jgi:acetyl esterase/lipase
MQGNAPFDWMTPELADQLGAWLGAAGGRDHPLYRPMTADLTGLAPLLIQSGEVEIFRDMIESFRSRAVHADADIVFQAWPDMNHNFQCFGDLLSESRAALDKITAFVSTRCGAAN